MIEQPLISLISELYIQDEEGHLKKASVTVLREKEKMRPYGHRRPYVASVRSWTHRLD